MTTKEIPKKKNLIYVDEVRVSNEDHTKIIKQNFRLFYQNAENSRKQLLLQKLTFSKKVALDKHQFFAL